MEIPVFGEGVESLADSCFKLTPPQNPTDDLPWLKDAQLHLEHHGERASLIVSTRYTIQHPAMAIGVMIQCGGQVRRDFTVLLGPQELAQASLATSEAPTQSPVPARSEARPTRRPVERSAPARKPPPATEAPPKERPEREVARAPKPAPNPRLAPAPTQDRLQVSRTEGSEVNLRQTLEIGASKTGSAPDASTRERLRREQQLILAIDDRISTELELAERIRQLEYQQKRLQEENLRLQSLVDGKTPSALSTGSASAPAASPAPARDWRIWGLGGAVLCLLSGAGLWLARRPRRTPAPSIETLPFTPLASAQRAPDLDMDFELEPLTTADIWPDRAQEKPSSTGEPVVDWAAPATVSPATLGPSSLLHIDDAVEEHDSAVELAEIMMSFGRVHGAAETLADFIRANPKQAVKPWVKLLEVYRTANMRVEFDALAQQLNKTFNVKAVCWEDFDEIARSDDSLEKMAHITKRIVDTWATRDCQIYIYTLLRDNRKGTRQGFPIGIVDDLLCLSGVLESLLGAYRPSPEEIAAAQASGQAAQLPVSPETAPVPPMPELDMLFSPPDDVLAPPDLPNLPEKAPPHVQSFTHTELELGSVESMIEFNLDEAYPPQDPKHS